MAIYRYGFTFSLNCLVFSIRLLIFAADYYF